MRALLTSALALATAFPALAGAQDAGDRRDRGDAPGIVGIVVDRETRQPIEGVAVTLRPLADAPATLARPPVLLTDARGRFLLADLASGRYGIAIERIGYQSVIDSVAYRSELGLRIDVEMVADAVEMDPLLVVAEARSRNLDANGFYDRRRRGIGRFVSRDEIQKGSVMRVSDIFRTMAGVRMSSGGRISGQGGVALLRGGCRADVYLDGVRTIPPFPVDALLHPNDLDAVEVYHGSELPSQFGTTSCGAIVIWTHVPNPRTGQPFSWKRLGIVAGFIAAAFLLTR
ncbi:MAG: carboxypeptidase regulatory-like domain-containing protein [Gemmatimonadetes bacterium]|nr:carboxypeptidase regulatory-like domain-containing protein [Gemmatimonadota bacterium]